MIAPGSAEDTAECYLDGRFLPLAQARIHPLDRGFVFGDGVYEVLPAYGAHFLRLGAHLERLARSLAAVRIANPHSPAQWATLLRTLRERAGAHDQSVYVQVTRGVAPRDHAFPDCAPTVFALSRPLAPVGAAALEQGLSGVLQDDPRWQRCDIKSIALQGAVLARQAAVDAGADEALLVRDGHVTEGAATNVFAVCEGAVVTPPVGPWLLAGVTRALVLELAAAAGLAVCERHLTVAEVRAAGELWLSSSTKGVLALTRLDGQTVGDGRPGPVWRSVQARYRAYLADVRAGRADDGV